MLLDYLLDAVGFLPAPQVELTAPKVMAFEDLASKVRPSGGQTIDYSLPYPKHEFLTWLAESHPEVAFHGTRMGGLTQLSTVRRSRDLSSFGNQQAVYASSDPLWAMYFAVLNRSTNPGFMGTRNSCTKPSKRKLFRRTYYMFSVNPEAHNQQLWINGWIYFLPASAFVSEKPTLGIFDSAHLVAYEPVECWSALEVTPADFPFRDQVTHHVTGDSDLKVLRRLRSLKRRM